MEYYACFGSHAIIISIHELGKMKDRRIIERESAKKER